MEMPTKKDVRTYRQPSGDLSGAAAAAQEKAATSDLSVQIFTGFTDQFAREYAEKLEKNGRRQALVDAYERTKKGEKQPIKHEGMTIYSTGYEDMSKKIYTNQLKLDADNIVRDLAVEHKDDPGTFANAMQEYMQKTEAEIPEEMREIWHQELVGLSSVALRKIEDNALKNFSRDYAASVVQAMDVMQRQGLDAADMRNAAMVDRSIRQFTDYIWELPNNVMDPAKKAEVIDKYIASVGEASIMAEFKDGLESGLDVAKGIYNEFKVSHSEEGTDPWLYNTEERDDIAAKMAKMIKAIETENKAKTKSAKADNNYKLGELTKILEDGGTLTKDDLTWLTTISKDDVSASAYHNFNYANKMSIPLREFNAKTLIQQEQELQKLENTPAKERSRALQKKIEYFRTAKTANETKINNDKLSFYYTNILGKQLTPITQGGDSFVRGLKMRKPFAEDAAAAYGGNKVYLSEAEAQRFASEFTGKSYPEMVSFAQTVTDTLGEDAVYVFDQISKENAPMLTMAGNLAVRQLEDPSDRISQQLTSEIAVGMDLIETTPGIVPAKAAGYFTSTIGTSVNHLGPNTIEQYREAVKAVAAHRISAAGIANVPDTDSEVQKIVEEATLDVLGGQPFVYNGNTIIPPWRGAKPGEFKDAVATLVHKDPEQFANLTDETKDLVVKNMYNDRDKAWGTGIFLTDSNLRYKSLGNGRYRVYNNNNIPIRDKNGAIFTIKLTKPR